MRKPPPLAAALVAFAGLITLNCLWPIDSCACSPAPRSAIVYGTVTSAAGPVAGARVEVRPLLGGGTLAVQSTGLDGGYRLLFTEVISESRALISVEPDSASGLAAATEEFVPRWFSGPVGDSVRTDIHLVSR